jgi:hypothetical protein
MKRYPLTQYRPASAPEMEAITPVKSKQLKPRTQSLMVQATLYISLALFIFVVIRGGAPEVALFLPFVLALLKVILGRKE